MFPKPTSTKKPPKPLRSRQRKEWEAERASRPAMRLPDPLKGQRGVITRITVEACPKPKGPTAKPGKRAPTVAEARWMDAIVRYGCIACRIDGGMQRAPAVHHLLRGGVRMGHLFTLPLCDPGHHQGGEQFGMVSRHPWKARFEEKYGTEAELLARLQKEITHA